MLPLDGTTVVALEQAVAAPFATRQLADLGARVIKVERPGDGDFSRGYDRTVHGDSSYFVWLNRGKESIELDIKDESDRRVLDALIDAADVVIQNLVPGAHAVYGGSETRRTGAKHASIAPYSPYATGDGNQVFLGVQSDREWVRLCHDVLGRPDLAEDPRFARNPERVANDHLITPLIESAFATLDADRVIALLDDAGIACVGRLRS